MILTKKNYDGADHLSAMICRVNCIILETCLEKKEKAVLKYVLNYTASLCAKPQNLTY